MKSNNKNIEELIKVIEVNKHDITMKLRGVVLDPISSINRPGAATDDYFREMSQRNEEVKNWAKDIMGIFAKRWRNPEALEDDQLASIQSYLDSISTSIIPRIKKIVDFYSLCSSKRHYFTSSEKGNKALKDFEKAQANCEKVCERLKNLFPNSTEEEVIIESCNLIELLQKGLDSIYAEISYVDEWKNSKIQIQIDESEFLNHVLYNIKENIERHGFGTPKFRNLFVWDKKVLVEITDMENCYAVSISNNGEPFTGNVGKVFDYGYCHGQTKHSGIGMHSIKQTMMRFGGDVEFEKSTNPFFSTTYKLMIKKL